MIRQREPDTIGLAIETSKRIVLVGTGTAVGKTHVGCSLIHGLANAGHRAIGLKPVETGVSPPDSPPREASDQERLYEASTTFHVKQSSPIVFHVKRSLYAFTPAVSPHLAARAVGIRIDLGAICGWIAEHTAPIVVVETAGGLFSPLGPGFTNLDLARGLRPTAVVLIGADRLGALHDVTATLGLASARGCPIDATVLSAPDTADLSTGSNAAELEQLGIVRPVATFPRAREDHPSSLAAANKLIAALLSD